MHLHTMLCMLGEWGRNKDNEYTHKHSQNIFKSSIDNRTNLRDNSGW